MAEVIESCPLLVILVPTCLQWDSLGNRLRGGFVVRIILESGLRNVGVPCGTVVKNPHANARDAGLIPGSGRSTGEGNGNPPVFLPGKSHGQMSLVDYSPWGRKELDTTNHHHVYVNQLNQSI